MMTTPRIGNAVQQYIRLVIVIGVVSRHLRSNINPSSCYTLLIWFLYPNMLILPFSKFIWYRQIFIVCGIISLYFTNGLTITFWPIRVFDYGPIVPMVRQNSDGIRIRMVNSRRVLYKLVIQPKVRVYNNK
jgi:hypothetical protein